MRDGPHTILACVCAVRVLSAHDNRTAVCAPACKVNPRVCVCVFERASERAKMGVFGLMRTRATLVETYYFHFETLAVRAAAAARLLHTCMRANMRF